MTRYLPHSTGGGWTLTRTLGPTLAIAGALAAAACGAAGKTTEQAPSAPPPVAIAAAKVESQPVTRFIRVTGTLSADEQASVSAEIAGRVIETPVERGAKVSEGSPLVRISPVEAEAQLREAEANAAQIQARLGIGADGQFDLEKVPEVINARASYALAEADYARIQTLLDQKVVSQSEFDQRRTQVDVARQQYESAKNAAAQQQQALVAARARVTLARKALSDTSVKAPFSGLVAERKVSVGDYVTRGTPIATVVRITPLRVQLTVPEQSVAQVKVGQPVALEVNTYPGQTFTGTIRYVSPALRAEERALTVEAVVPNEDGRLKPGFFATAAIEQSAREPALMIPASAVQTLAGTSRVYVVKGDHVEAHIITTGQTIGARVEVTRGLTASDTVAVGDLAQLSDGARVRAEAGGATAEATPPRPSQAEPSDSRMP